MDILIYLFLAQESPQKSPSFQIISSYCSPRQNARLHRLWKEPIKVFMSSWVKYSLVRNRKLNCFQNYCLI